MNTQQMEVPAHEANAEQMIDVLDLVPEMLGLVGGGGSAPVVCFE